MHVSDLLNLDSDSSILIDNCCTRKLLTVFTFRILKRLKNKTTKEIELEKLEKGFSIYLNGANAEAGRKQHKISKHKTVSSKPVWKPIWTAGMLLLLVLLH